MHHSAVSRRIRDLELTLGAALFDRHPGGVRPTTVGARFLRDLRRVLADLDGTLSMMERAGRGEHGSLSIGLNGTLIEGELLETVGGFMRDRPDIAVRFVEATGSELAERLGDGAIDMAIGPEPNHRVSKASLPLWRDRIVVTMAADHPLADRASVDWSDLQGEKILTNMDSIEPTFILGPTVSYQPSSIVRHDVSRTSLLSLVRQGLGITLVAQSNAHSPTDGIVFAGLYSQGRPVRLRYFVHWRPGNSNPVLAAFLTTLRTRYSPA